MLYTIVYAVYYICTKFYVIGTCFVDFKEGDGIYFLWNNKNYAGCKLGNYIPLLQTPFSTAAYSNLLLRSLIFVLKMWKACLELRWSPSINELLRYRWHVILSKSEAGILTLKSAFNTLSSSLGLALHLLCMTI